MAPDPSQELELIIHEVLADSPPTKSGIGFAFCWRTIFPPEVESQITDDELLEWYTKKLKEYYDVKKFKKSKGYRAKVIERAKKLKKREYTGGAGITCRTLEEMEESVFKGITKRIRSEQGKIVFLGNGLSPVPVEIAHRYETGEVKEKPIIVDMFDYLLFLEDLTDLKERFDKRQREFVFDKELNELNKIVTQIKKGNLTAVNYYFSSEDVPEIIKNASLAINSYGPPASTIEEQASILAPGGELYIYEKYIPPLKGFKVIQICNKFYMTQANIIRRL